MPITPPPSSWGPLPHLQSQGPQAPGLPGRTTQARAQQHCSLGSDPLLPEGLPKHPLEFPEATETTNQNDRLPGSLHLSSGKMTLPYSSGTSSTTQLAWITLRFNQKYSQAPVPSHFIIKEQSPLTIAVKMNFMHIQS